MEDAVLLFLITALAAVIISVVAIALFLVLLLGFARLCGRYWYRRLMRNLFPKYRH